MPVEEKSIIHRSDSIKSSKRYIKALDNFSSRINSMKISEESKNKCISSGFDPSRSYLYDFEKYNETLYLNDIERRLTQHINGKYSIVFHDKLLTYQALSHYIKTPEIHYIIKDSKIEFQSKKIKKLIEKDSSDFTLFIKPVNGAGGKGALKIKVESGLLITEEGNIPLNNYIESISYSHKNLIITDVLSQSDFMGRLNHESINTIRLLTVRDPESKEIFAARGIVRVGNKKSGHVDNFSSGGYAYILDLESGIIGKGQSKKCHFKSKISHHIDDKDLIIDGLKLPNYEEIIRKSIELHKYMPYANYVGWDFCIDSNEIILVEANNTTDVDVLQMFSPLLTDSRLVKFYRHHNII